MQLPQSYFNILADKNSHYHIYLYNLDEIINIVIYLLRVNGNLDFQKLLIISTNSNNNFSNLNFDEPTFI